jgi:hypothetical protein
VTTLELQRNESASHLSGSASHEDLVRAVCHLV